MKTGNPKQYVFGMKRERLTSIAARVGVLLLAIDRF